jgi:hypothetical protein
MIMASNCRHFVTWVITESKPTDALLSDALAPFGPDGTSRWDAWTLGGRYSGNIPVKRLEDTLTGGDEIPESDLALMKMLGGEGARVERPVHRGSGVDATQIGNIDWPCGVAPLALVFNGDWHQCPIFPIEALAVKLGLPIEEGTTMKAERDTMRQWDIKLADLLHDASRNSWLAIVDCHN